MNEGAQTYPGGELHALVASALKAGQDCFVGLMDCAHATNRAALQASVAKIGDVTIKWVFFENRADKANENCRRDPSRSDVAGNIAQNERWSADYDIPPEAEVLEIFAAAKPASDPED